MGSAEFMHNDQLIWCMHDLIKCSITETEHAIDEMATSKD